MAVLVPIEAIQAGASFVAAVAALKLRVFPTVNETAKEEQVYSSHSAHCALEEMTAEMAVDSMIVAVVAAQRVDLVAPTAAG